MSDDSTRSGSLGGLGSDKTQLHARKIQVKMPSGKIYGPYQRLEILSFIAAGRMKGDEWILIEGQGDWKIVTSDPEFFDALQQALFGTKSRDKSKSGVPSVPAAPSPGAVSPPKNSLELKIPKTTVGIPESSPPKSEDPQAPKKAVELELDVPLPSPVANPFEAPAPSPESLIKLPPTKKPYLKTLPLWQKAALGSILVGVVLGLLHGTQRSPSDPVKKAEHLFSFSAKPQYFKPLVMRFERLKGPVPLMPEKLNPGEWALPDGLSADDWIRDLQALSEESQKDQRLSSSYWARWAWDLLWLSGAVQAADAKQAERLQREGLEILSSLRDQKLVPQDMDILFSSIDAFNAGRWDEVITKLKPLTNNETAQALVDEAAWWSFWEKDASGVKPTPSREGYSAPSWDAGFKLRSAFLNREEDASELIDEYAAESPWAALPWFVSAELNWRLIPGQIQKANTRFIVGLGVLSLAPRSIQLVYWKQYASFLSTFGRQVTAEKGLANVKGLHDTSFAAWWDLGTEGLDISRVAADVLSKGTGGPMSPADIASLQILGPLMTQGPEAVVAAGQLMCLEGEWKRALGLFETALKMNPQAVSALGGAIWASASLFKFDKAFEYYDQLVKLPNAEYEGQKYDALIHFIGRETESGLSNMYQYTKKVPNDPWAFYYLARMYEKLEKNIECAKAAQLAFVHGSGELKFRSNLLRLNCLVLAKVGVKDALTELKNIQSKNPRSIPAILAYTSSLMTEELPDDALHLAEEAVRRMPRSYQLRMRIGEIYEKKRDYDKAVAFYLSASKERREAVEPRIKVAHVYEMQEKPLDAAANYKTAALINPEYPEIWLMAARAYAGANLWKEAAEFYQKEIEERPAVLSNFVEFAEFMLKINAPQEVPKIFQRFKSNYEEDPRVLTRLAQAYLAMKDYENARMAASTARARDPSLAEPYRILAICSEQQNVYQSAKEFYEKYLSLSPRASDTEQIRLKLSKPPFTQ